MKRDKQQLIDYLEHILQAIERIDRYVDELDEVAFLSNELVQDAVVRNFEIMGEASNNILKYFPLFAEQNPELPLAVVYQMRNALAHGYFKVDYEIVWATIESNLTEIHAQIQKSIHSLMSQR